MKAALAFAALATTVAALDANSTIYKIDYPKKGDCGQTSCAPSACNWPIKFGGFKEGTCASQGYTVADGTMTTKIPVIGIENTYDLFAKAGVSLDANSTIYKIDYPKKGDCGQTSCAPSACNWPIKFGGFKEGTCASQGYTVADGTMTTKIPVIGIENTYDLFAKASVEAGQTKAKDILVVSFAGGDSATEHKWEAHNDPVMGGQSYSTVSVDNGMLNFTGACKIVPSLKAPGFITARADDGKAFVDVSSCEGIRINHMSATPYKGFRISFGTAHAPGGGFFASGYKADISSPSVGKFGDAVLPFNTFTDDWNDATGNPVKTCAENKIYCPTQKSLEDFKKMSIWAEGVEGDITLLVKSITGYNCK